jgi:hypothetical protein
VEIRLAGIDFADGVECPGAGRWGTAGLIAAEQISFSLSFMGGAATHETQGHTKRSKHRIRRTGLIEILEQSTESCLAVRFSAEPLL